MKIFKLVSAAIVSLSTIVLAALRTVQMFYVAGERSSHLFFPEGHPFLSTLSVVDAGAALLSIEFGIVAYSFIKVIENKGHVPRWIYNAQLFTLIMISVFAGVGQSLGLIENLSERVLEFFTYLLVAVMGVGASFAAWASGEILGSQIYQFFRGGKKAKGRKNKTRSRRKKKVTKEWTGDIDQARDEFAPLVPAVPKKKAKAKQTKKVKEGPRENYESDLGI